MKITCDRQQLLDIVLNVQKAVSLKSTIPAIEGILFEANEKQLKMVGYNLELGITTVLDVTVLKEGSIILNAKLFSEIIRKMPDKIVTISTDDNYMTNIVSGLSEFSILGINAEDFPELPSISDSSNISITGQTLKNMITQTLFAVSENDSKPIHTGSLFDISDSKISIVSVDGYRLAMKTEHIKTTETFKFVVPGKTLGELSKLIPEKDTDIKIIIGRRHIIFEIENYSVISRLLEGEFLDYKSAIPLSKETQITVNKREFINSIDRLSLLITDRVKSPIKCVFSDNQIKMSCSTFIGKASDEINSVIDGKAVEIGFNNKYLLDALKNSDCDEVLIQLNGALSPMKILPIEGESFLFLVLPVRLKSE